MLDQTVNGLLVCKYSWVCASRPEDLYVFVVQLPNGRLMEFKQFRFGMKRFYNSLDVGDDVQVDYDIKNLLQPNDDYSLALGEVYGNWSMSYSGNEWETPFKVPARRSIKSWWMHGQPGHMIGHYVNHWENEEASRKSFASYYVEFKDMHGVPFVCQFWSNEKLEDEFLPEVEYYDKILILNARELPMDRYSNMPNYTYRLVTSYSPVQGFEDVL